MSRISKSFIAAAMLALLATGATLAHAAGNRYQQTNLVSDGVVPAAHVDPNLKNPWGIAFNPFGLVWVADNLTGVSTLYDGFGNPNALIVTIPPAPTTNGPGSPTGIVFSGSNTDFIVTQGAASAPARFIFATLDGVIAAWAPPATGSNAIRVATKPGAVYTGLALAGNGEANFLYAANFAAGKIDVFDHNFAPAAMPGGFVDPHLPKNFAPFNIQAIQGDLYIAYALREEDEAEEVIGPGLGIVSVFDANGHFLRRVATRGKLNAPWGFALAPASFGKFGGRLLVGNFGDGTINAYDAHNGEFKGQLRGTNGKPLKIEGLWGIAFGNGINHQPAGTLFFAAGPEDETRGIYGAITPVAGTPDDNDD
jgi:uncharacterized protein (TIGR03118 family)